MTANEDPMRWKLRSDIEEPKCVISNTDKENTDPKRAMPRRETDAPSRDNFLREKVDPRCKKSKMDRDEPTRVKHLRDIEAPRWENSMTDRENSDPILAMPNNDTDAPKRP